MRTFGQTGAAVAASGLAVGAWAVLGERRPHGRIAAPPERRGLAADEHGARAHPTLDRHNLVDGLATAEDEPAAQLLVDPQLNVAVLH